MYCGSYPLQRVVKMELSSHVFWVNHSSRVYNCLQDWNLSSFIMLIKMCVTNYPLLCKLKATMARLFLADAFENSTKISIDSLL